MKQIIKEYWEDKQPGKWYSKKEYGTKEYYEEVAFKRHNHYCIWINCYAGFDQYKGKKILEVGVGMGTDLKQYAQYGANCYGVDLPEGSITATRKHLETFRLTADLQVMDAEDLKFEDNIFDMVYSFGVLHHTPETQKAIDEIYRVLKPNGKVIIMLYSRTWKHYILRVLWIGILHGKLIKHKGIQGLINYYSEAYGDSPLTKLYSKRQIKNFLSTFNDVKISHWHYKATLPTNSIIEVYDSIRDRKGWKFMQGNWIITGEK